MMASNVRSECEGVSRGSVPHQFTSSQQQQQQQQSATSVTEPLPADDARLQSSHNGTVTTRPHQHWQTTTTTRPSVSLDDVFKIIDHVPVSIT